MTSDTDQTLLGQSAETAANMTEVMDISHKIWKRFIEGQAGEGMPRNADPLNTMPAWKMKSIESNDSISHKSISSSS